MTQSSPRPGRWPLLGLFVCAGLSNLCKGPLVGPMLIGATVGSYLLLQCVLEKSVRPLRPYLWLPGWLLAVAIGFWWVVVIWRHFPDFRQNLLFDYAQTDQYNQPFWYYLRELPGRFLPWTPVALLGLWIAWTRRRERVMQLLLCWSIFPILLLSIPNRKHHHYLVPCLAPWAILTAAALPAIAREMFDGPAWSRKPSFGLATFGLLGAAGIAAAFWFNRQKFQQPIAVTAGLILVWLACVYFFYFGLLRQNGRWVFGAVIAGLLVAYCWGQSYVPDENAADNVFLREANAAVPPDAPLYINAAQHSKRDGMTLDFFRVQFYSRPNARLLHNLTFLRDRTITAPVVYVITRLNDAPELETLGRATPVVESRHFRQQTDEGDRLALFRLEFRPDLQRYEAPREITTMQAMGRAPGPNCGPAASPQSSGR